MKPVESDREKMLHGSSTPTGLLVWKLHSLDHRMASVRYRAILPIMALKQKGVKSRIYRSLSVERVRHAEAVIFVKSVTVKDLILVQRVSQHGIPLVLDLCDNIFVSKYMQKCPITPAEVFQMMASYAAVITTTGPALAQVIRKHVGSCVPIVIIPDGVETDCAAREGRRLLFHTRLVERIRQWSSVGYWINGLGKLTERVRDRVIKHLYLYTERECSQKHSSLTVSVKLQQSMAADVARGDSSFDLRLTPVDRGVIKRIIWFGNAGAEYGRFGLCDIVDIADRLVKANARVKFELLVVSNDQKAYEEQIKPLPFQSRYVGWNHQTIHDWIKQSDLAIIPNSKDEFAICKSANRAVLALQLGVPVVATSTPALEPLRDCITVDDWEEGVVRYLTTPTLVRSHLEKAQAIISKEFSDRVLADKWRHVVQIAKGVVRREEKPPQISPIASVVVVLHLVQDLDLAVPVLREGRRRNNMEVRVWVSKSLLEKSPRVLRTLRALKVPFMVIADDSMTDLIIMGFDGIDAVLTIAETNQRAHRFPHAVTKRANDAGVLTYTMQHGYENIGLTYSDSVHPIRQVKFAAKRIFVWGDLTSLHPQIRKDTRAKCVPVGCTKEPPSARPDIDALNNLGLVVGIFENLHWHRYDQSYIDKFLADCMAIAKSHQAITFLIKPHHAGRWLTSRYHGPVPRNPNLMIADPLDQKWESYTANQLLGRLDAVITTPSTVALDAARARKPVAVVGYGLDLSVYSPLPVISDARQWDEFVQQVKSVASRQVLVDLAEEFVTRKLYPGNAVSRILETIVRDTGKGVCAGGLTDRPIRALAAR